MKAFFLACVIALSSQAHASSYDDNLRKLFEITGVINNYISLNTQVINQMQTGYLRAADESIDSISLTVDQKKQAGEILKSRFASMVKDYESHIKLYMPYEKVVDEIYLPLYKETYSNLDILLRERTGLPVSVAEDPLTCVVVVDKKGFLRIVIRINTAQKICAVKAQAD